MWSKYLLSHLNIMRFAIFYQLLAMKLNFVLGTVHEVLVCVLFHIASQIYSWVCRAPFEYR